jgi:anaerobic selenocysteine-containing dehydrogenase
MRDSIHGICRSCAAMCPIVIDREDGRPVRIIGDKHNPVYWGYTCIKGREMVNQLRHPDRLLGSLRREADGSFTPIASAQALDEVTEKLQRIIAEHGPRAVATYAGTYIFTYPATQPVSTAWMHAIGSPMMFTSSTIDQPGKAIAAALHGTWAAGPQVFDDADTWLLVGVNPIVAHSGGVPNQNPAKRLKEAVERGMKPIVLDPRRTECAERAFVHLQARPGEDPAVLAGMIRVILKEAPISCARTLPASMRWRRRSSRSRRNTCSGAPTCRRPTSCWRRAPSPARGAAARPPAPARTWRRAAT